VKKKIDDMIWFFITTAQWSNPAWRKGYVKVVRAVGGEPRRRMRGGHVPGRTVHPDKLKAEPVMPMSATARSVGIPVSVFAYASGLTGSVCEKPGALGDTKLLGRVGPDPGESVDSASLSFAPSPGSEL
jgi:hypothetical protein